MSTAFVVVPATILASCNPGRAHDTNARDVLTAQVVSGVSGVSSSIHEYDPFYTGNNPTGTNASVMLVNNGGSQWAQVGWLKSKLDGGVVKRERFVEFFEDITHNFFHFWAAHSVTSTNNYKILYNTSTGVFSYYDNEILLRTDSGIAAPAAYQIMGETHDKADQMEGSVGAHEVFSSETYYTAASHLAHTVVVAIGVDPLYGGEKGAAGHYEIWDKGCA